MHTAAAKCFMDLLGASSKLLPATLPERQGGDGKKKNKIQFSSKMIFLSAFICLYTLQRQGHTAGVVISFENCWKFPHSSFAA